MQTNTLTNKLSELDKKRIKNYILKYGAIESSPMREKIAEDPEYVDRWLSEWAKSKKKLYRLFGNSFIFTKKINIEKPEGFLYDMYKNLIKELDNFNKNGSSYRNILNYVASDDFLIEIKKMKIYDSKTGELIFNKEYESLEGWRKSHFELQITESFVPFTRFSRVQEGVVIEGMRYKRDLPNGRFKELRISAGEKLEKAQNKLFDFLDFEERHPDFFAQYKWFMKELNQFKSQKQISAILCLSIHPLDFMTMSDNNSHWSSCMNWTEEDGGGCYRIGTVEMMNSNNVVCAYLLPDKESKQTWFFGCYDKDWYGTHYVEDAEEGDEEWTWNNKMWRCLYYIEKDILLSGKSYPYYQKDLNFIVLETLKDLVAEKFNWHYTIGIQRYKDMVTCAPYSLYNARENDGIIYDRHCKTYKKKILIDTCGMYNDFLNDNDYPGYFCYRNKVRKTKVINVSGTPLSITTTKPFKRRSVIYELYKYTDEYNDRFGETDWLY